MLVDYKLVPLRPGATDQAEKMMNELNHRDGYIFVGEVNAQGHAVIVMSRDHVEEAVTVLDADELTGLPLEDDLPVEVVQEVREIKRRRRK